MSRHSKKAIICEYVERHRPSQADRADAAAIREQIQRELGPAGRISNDYLMGVLDELGVPVSRELRGVSPDVYAMLHFGSLDAAERMLRQLDARYRAALEESNAERAADCRDGALLVRRRCEVIARNRRVAPAKRAEKQEIAHWCAIWLQTPEMFFDWLELRKRTDDYRRLATESASNVPL